MGRNIKVIVSLIMSMFLLFFSVSRVYAAEEKDDYVKEYKENIYHMSKMMRCIPKTGDINLDYLYEMVMLSEGEVEFANAYVRYASSEEVRDIASGYIKRESAAIDNMKSIIESLKDSTKKDENVEEKYLKSYNNELNKMICRFQKVELTENMDRNFLRFISIHHDGVIAITDMFLKSSYNDQVKEVADKLNNEMKSDIDKINKVIKIN